MTALFFTGCPENRCGMDCLDFCYCKENVKTINEELYGHCPGDCDRNWQKIDNKCNTSKSTVENKCNADIHRFSYSV